MLSFERGNPQRPRGHALAYFKSSRDQSELYATYLVVPPISIDLAKYMPPMFASKMSVADMQTVSAIPLPPIPEKVSGPGFLTHLAELREDDILFLGIMDPEDVTSLLARVGDAGQEYLHACSSLQDVPAEPEQPPLLSASVGDVLYRLMGERDKLGELAKLLGKLRYAVDGADGSAAKDTVEEMEALARHLPEKLRVQELIVAARVSGEKGRKLSELYISRCYKLSEEDYRAVEEIETRIRQFETGA